MFDELATQLFLIVVFSSFVLCILVLGTLFYRDSPLREHRQRRQLWRALRETELATVLTRLGIPLAWHVHSTPVPVLREQIQRCRDCQHRERCHFELHVRRANAPIAECPNWPELATLQSGALVAR